MDIDKLIKGVFPDDDEIRKVLCDWIINHIELEQLLDVVEAFEKMGIDYNPYDIEESLFVVIPSSGFSKYLDEEVREIAYKFWLKAFAKYGKSLIEMEGLFTKSDADSVIWNLSNYQLNDVIILFMQNGYEIDSNNLVSLKYKDDVIEVMSQKQRDLCMNLLCQYKQCMRYSEEEEELLKVLLYYGANPSFEMNYCSDEVETCWDLAEENVQLRRILEENVTHSTKAVKF